MTTTKDKLAHVKVLPKHKTQEFVCGWGAAFVNITVTYPIHKIMFRQMLHGVKIGPALLEIKQEGTAFLYRGILPPLAQKTISSSLMFGVYDGVRRPLLQLGVNEYRAKIVAGLTAGTVEAILMPFERIQTLLSDSLYHTKFRNTTHAFHEIYFKYGFRELYRGLTPVLCRNGPSNSLFFILREEAAAKLPRHEDAVKQAIQEFISGAVIGASLSSLYYPINVVKVAMQTQIGTPYMTIGQTFASVYAERGSKLRHIYKGVGLNCTRAFISWGIINVAYEGMKKTFFTDSDDH